MALVIELQEAAYNSDIALSDLMNKAYFLAKKLNVDDFAEWLLLEINGYPENSILPDYRYGIGVLESFDVRGIWIPAYITNDENLNIKIVTLPIFNSVSQLEVLSKNSFWYAKFDPTRNLFLATYFKLETSFRLSLSQILITKIFTAIKIKIINWSLELEKNQIMGDHMTFTKEEKQRASTITHITNHFNGDSTTAQFQTNSNNSNQKIINTSQDLEALKKLLVTIEENLAKMDLPQNSIDEIAREMQNIKVSLIKPDNNLIINSFKSIKTIIEGAAGNLVASGVLYHIQHLLPN